MHLVSSRPCITVEFLYVFQMLVIIETGVGYGLALKSLFFIEPKEVSIDECGAVLFRFTLSLLS